MTVIPDAKLLMPSLLGGIRVSVTKKYRRTTAALCAAVLFMLTSNTIAVASIENLKELQDQDRKQTAVSKEISVIRLLPKSEAESGLERTLKGFVVKSGDVTLDTANEIVRAVTKYGAMYKIDPLLIMAIIEHESNYAVLALSNTGALGLMQILPRWHIDKIIALGGGKYLNLYDIDTNVHLGSQFFAEKLRDTRDTGKALARYYGGESKATEDYMKNVMNRYSRMKSVYNEVLASERQIVVASL